MRGSIESWLSLVPGRVAFRNVVLFCLFYYCAFPFSSFRVFNLIQTLLPLLHLFFRCSCFSTNSFFPNCILYPCSPLRAIRITRTMTHHRDLPRRRETIHLIDSIHSKQHRCPLRPQNSCNSIKRIRTKELSVAVMHGRGVFAFLPPNGEAP